METTSTLTYIQIAYIIFQNAYTKEKTQGGIEQIKDE